MKIAKWISTFFGLVAGVGLAANNPRLVLQVVVVIALAALVWTVAKDRSPDLDTVAILVVIPSLIIEMSGKGAAFLNRWLAKLWDWAAGWAGPWSGVEGSFALAVIMLAFAWVLMKRASGGGGGMPSRIASGGGR